MWFSPKHKHIFTYKQGEWLAFTTHAAESGHWDVVASVASGANGRVNTFRILANATNCSSGDTDGFDGMGTDGVDLLNGPVTFDWTGSWEAFETAGQEDVWVPQGTHRLLFCADSDEFNLNYIRIYTPIPTPAPTPVPTMAPTFAPTVPEDSASQYTWIYIAVSKKVLRWWRSFVEIVFFSCRMRNVHVCIGGSLRRWTCGGSGHNDKSLAFSPGSTMLYCLLSGKCVVLDICETRGSLCIHSKSRELYTLS